MTSCAGFSPLHSGGSATSNEQRNRSVWHAMHCLLRALRSAFLLATNCDFESGGYLACLARTPAIANARRSSGVMDSIRALVRSLLVSFLGVSIRGIIPYEYNIATHNFLRFVH